MPYKAVSSSRDIPKKPKPSETGFLQPLGCPGRDDSGGTPEQSHHNSCDISAVNTHGQYVGTRCVGNVIQDGPYPAILWQDGRRYDLNGLIPQGSGWELMHATGINNHGVIVGTGIHDGHMRAFRLTPI